ncbi:MAG: hypothetical protein GOV00_01285 [Candidatus Altiarchaeota archaeon]|nr:hypothetical protein [Candidatus Altiarchaeota archaeon]
MKRQAVFSVLFLVFFFGLFTEIGFSFDCFPKTGYYCADECDSEDCSIDCAPSVIYDDDRISMTCTDTAGGPVCESQNEATFIGELWAAGPYFCFDSVWATCSGSRSFHTGKYACASGTLYSCGVADKGTQKGDCDSVTADVKLYCYSGAWVSADNVHESCPAACVDEGKTWTGTACCDDTTDYYLEDGVYNSIYYGCNSGQPKPCTYSLYTCSEMTIDLGTDEGTYYCSSSGWASSSNACSDCAEDAGSVCEDCTDQTLGDKGIKYFGTDACCGNAASEYWLSRACSGGCSPDSNDDACCAGSDDCVYSSTCYGDQSCENFGDDLFCNSGSWTANSDLSPTACTCLSTGEWLASTINCCNSDESGVVDGSFCCDLGTIKECTSGLELIGGAKTCGGYTCVDGVWEATGGLGTECFCDGIPGCSSDSEYCELQGKTSACVYGDLCYDGNDDVTVSGITYVCKIGDSVTCGEWLLKNGEDCTQDLNCYSEKCVAELNYNNYVCSDPNYCPDGVSTHYKGSWGCHGNGEKTQCVYSTTYGRSQWDTANEVTCSSSSEVGDIGNQPFRAGKVIEASGKCTAGVCDSEIEFKDTCVSPTQLTEYYLSGETKVSATHSTSSYQSCFNGNNYNTSKCVTYLTRGKLVWEPHSLDSGEDYCTGCSKSWINNGCCETGDDITPYLNGEPTGAACENGVPKTCSGTSCSSTINVEAETYYCLSSIWTPQTLSIDSCQGACEAEAYDWNGACCYSANEGLDGNELCHNNIWYSATGNKGTYFNEYLSDDAIWNVCTTPDTYLVLNINGDDTKFICNGEVWEDEECAAQGDTSRTMCEEVCGKDWVGETDLTTCCGNNAEDEFEINGTYACADGGAQMCTIACDSLDIGATTYYCHQDNWQDNSLFVGSTLVQGPAESSGCCNYGQCWDAGCFDSGLQEGTICSQGTWVECTTDNLCQSMTVAGQVYYCTDNGWAIESETFCDIMSGACSEGVCKKCGLDYNFGEDVEGLMCTSAGIFSGTCMSDDDCVASNDCTQGVCDGGQCAQANLACGTTCPTGFCSGAGLCSPPLASGQVCACGELCSSGLYCDDTTSVCKTPESCGDGVCQVGECSACTEDCTLDQCIDDGTCSTLIGETCQNSGDCSCYGASCNPTSPQSDSRGCFANVCGNNVCEEGECSICLSDCSADTCSDNGQCDLVLGETCENSPNDCTCSLSVSEVNFDDIKIGQYGIVTFTIENTGNVPMIVDLDLIAAGIETNWLGSKRKQLSPGEFEDIEIRAKASSQGTYNINVLASSSQAGDLNVGTIAVVVKSSNFFADALALFKGSELYGTIFEPFEFLVSIAGILGVGFSVWKLFFSKVKKTNPYRMPLQGYYGSGYNRGYYNRQGGQFKGYYRQFK